MITRKRALVLSGGGAKGAFEIGALEYIHNVKPEYFDFQIIAGVSVGSLNGVMVAQQQFYQLQKLWDTISNERIYTGKINIRNTLWRLITGHNSVLGNKPLMQQIEEHVNLQNIKTDFRLGFVSLTTGEYKSCRHTEFGDDNNNFRQAILASCSMPVIWEPVKKVVTKSGTFEHLVDGGIRNVSPLGDVINDNPDEIIIINSNSKALSFKAKAAKNIIEIAKRSLTDITINEIFRSDIEEFIRINEIVHQCKKHNLTVCKNPASTSPKPYKYFNAIVIEPDHDLGDSLDFSQTNIQKIRSAGYDAAQSAFNKYKPIDGLAMARSFK